MVRCRWLLLLAAGLIASCNGTEPSATREAPMSTTQSATHTNRLAGSTSPYLLQHADNPVNWFPWGDEAFAKAKTEDKPVFLSIGYSSCHWCHVMERESFENEAIAAILNEHFVAIKVDREERPDVDQIYMNAVQMMTGRGGWPLSVFLTPDRKPFFGGTYFPPEDRAGMSGFKTILRATARAYRERRGDVDQAAEELTSQLRRLAAGPVRAAEALDAGPIARAVAALHGSFDDVWGGFGSAPKFPPTGALALLLRHHRRTGDRAALDVVTATLDRMAAGGIHDPLGGGFHRYAVDRRWLVPHFEKMLYDNALLAAVYLDAYRVTNRPRYARVARETLDYVLRVMTDEAGGFHSAQDADTDGDEGATYLWSRTKVEKVLGKDDAERFCRYYGVTAAGNFEGRNILHVPEPDEETAVRLAPLRAKLLAVRDRRPQPAKDDKVLCDWNALMISALARGAQVLGDRKYRVAAERAATFLLTTMRPQGNLLHAYRDGRAHVGAFLPDYAFLLGALIDLYEATFDAKWIRHAEDLAAEMKAALWDEKAGGFFGAPKGRADLLVRTKDAFDGAQPSGNAVAAHALLRLARLTDRAEYAEWAERTLRLFVPHAERAPQGFTRLLCALDFRIGPTREIVIAGDPADTATRALLDAVRRRYLPNTVVALGNATTPELPLLANRTPIDGKPAAYVCEGNACQEPVTSVSSLMKLLEPKPTASVKEK